MSKKIAILVGSLRKASFNRKIANELIRLQPEGLELEIVEIGEMPHYNEDLDTDTPPASWVDFREKIKTMNGVIFVTPEYNRTIPGVLKNAIDVGSRPYGSSVWNGKPGAVISVTPGTTGAFGANHNVRQAVVFLGVPMCPFEAYIGGVGKLFDDNGKLVESTENLLKNFLSSYKDWVEKF
ncbi:MAG: NAD(P)H-dependent oxidoreductase [Acidobacteria bacterium]|nr:NAD(P)H-dependent oxidoreductase [Acidobacteriota bacterium]